MSDVSPLDSDAAFVSLLTEHQLALQLYVRSLLPGDPAAGDVVQQANAKIWEKRADFELGTHFKAWAFSIARYEVLDYRKRQARDARMRFSDEVEELVATEMAESELDVSQRQLALRACLEKLKANDRQLLLHRYADSGSLAEYAAKVGRSVGGLRVTLHRLRSSLLTCMERKFSAGEVSS